MKLKLRLVKKINLIFALIIFILIITNINLLAAENLTASQYDLKLTLNNPQEIISAPVEINRSSLEAINSTAKKNIYLNRFTLKNAKGIEIPARYLKIETPHLQEQETLDNRHRFMILKNNQEKSWFKIGLTKEAAFFEPGEYTGIISIDDLDWEIKLTALIKAFVSFSVEDNNFEFEIAEPFSSDFFIADDLYQMKVDSNHSNWEIQAHLEDFINEEGENLDPKYLYYRLEAAARSTDIKQLQKDQFSNFNDDQTTIMINGRDYERGLRAIRFGLDLAREDAGVQQSGLYRGKIIFTLRILNNM
jgi:hypothetical protein